MSDLVSAELSVLRPTASPAPVPSLDVDSLELVALAAALSESLNLHESGIEDRLLVRPSIGNWVAIAKEGLEAYSSHMTFRTSGSTGAPKRCVHTLPALLQEVDELALMLQGRSRVLSAVRCHHIYGFLFTILLPRALSLPVDAFVDLRNQLPSAAFWRSGDLVIGHPDFWRVVARADAAIPPGVVGVTSTAPCPDDVARHLVTLGLETLLQVYGSSETAGVGVRTAPDRPYTLFSFWQRDDADSAALVRVEANGNRTSYPVQDVLAWSSDREFLPTGRRDEAIQVAGVNVFPSRERQVLMEHPGVLDASVRRMDVHGVDRLKAFIVPRHEGLDEAVLHVALEEWVANRLPAPERPKAYSFGNALPRDALGKPADWPLPAARSGLVAEST